MIPESEIEGRAAAAADILYVTDLFRRAHPLTGRLLSRTTRRLAGLYADVARNGLRDDLPMP